MADTLDTPYVEYRNRSIAHGVNNWTESTDTNDDVATVLFDVDIDSPGIRKKRNGRVAVGDSFGSTLIAGIQGFAPVGGSKTLVAESAGTLKSWDGSSTTFVQGKTGLNPNAQSQFVVAYNKIYRVSLWDNVFSSIDGNTWVDEGNADTNPPRCMMGLWTSINRLFLANSLLYPDYLWYSDALAPNVFDRTINAHKMAAGDNSPIMGMIEWTSFDTICFKKNRILDLNVIDTDPSQWPISSIATDIGCVAPGSVASNGVDVLFLDVDGVRSLTQSAQDKKRGVSLPLSKSIQGWIDRINWQYVSVAVAKTWNNRYYLAVPIDTSQVNNYVFVYNFLTGGWTVYSNWAVNCWTQMDFGNVNHLYYGDSATGSVREADTGLNDDGVAITYQEETKAIDFGIPQNNKVGQFIEIECKTQGGTNFRIYASLDSGDYTYLGMVDLSGAAPRLPQTLPFPNVYRQGFTSSPLRPAQSSLQPWRRSASS